MSQEIQSLRVETLLGLAEKEEEPLATLAEGLIPAAGLSIADLDDPHYKEIRERISSIVEQLLANDKSPVAVLNALLKIDETLAKDNKSPIPFATHLAPLATECALRAQRDRLTDQLDKELAELSPIFRPDKHTLLAAPLGLLKPEGLANFTDRILKNVHRQKTKRVVLVLSDPSFGKSDEAVWDTLAKDLAAQKIRLELLRHKGDAILQNKTPHFLG